MCFLKKYLISSFCFLLLFIFGYTIGYGQLLDKAEVDKKLAEKLAEYDLDGIKTSLFLNKSVFTTDEIELYRKLPRNKQGQIVTGTSADEWQSLYQRLIGADLSPGDKRIPDFERFAEKDPLKHSRINTVPIGIFNLDATMLTEQQLRENQHKKQQNQKADASSYERIHFISASVLQEDVFQADINFRISPSLHISNNQVKIERVELDFQDGKGYRSYPLSDQLISYHFSSIGERIISIRLLTDRGAFVFNSLINVRQLERIAPYREFEITAPRVREDTITPPERRTNGRMAAGVPGGNVRIVLGCDQSLNKPIIIAEGMDLGEDVNLDYLEAKYRPTFAQFLGQGYDLVFLDYHNGRDYIQNNAQVMKALINQINQIKLGSHSLIVIGESMVMFI